MKHQIKALSRSLPVIALFAFGSAGAATPFTDIAPDSSVDTCVARVAEYANYDNASRVRHQVESEKRRTYGHLLRIDTLVFDDADGALVREYATTCVVARDGTQLTFRIKQSKTAE